MRRAVRVRGPPQQSRSARVSPDALRRNGRGAPLQRPSEVALEERKRRREELPAWNDHDVEGAADRRSTEYFSNQAFSPIPLDGVAELPRRHDAEPHGLARAVGGNQDRHVAPLRTVGSIEHPLEFATASNSTDPGKTLGGHRGVREQISRICSTYDDETVRRFRPFARRRFRTMRPFLVDMRTRKPCVRLRRRRFGW